MENPSFVAVYAESWGAARRVLASRSRFYWIWIGTAALVGALALTVPDTTAQSSSGQPTHVPGVFIGVFVGWMMLAGVLAYFVLADAVRAFVPSFRMTVQVFALVFVLNMAMSFAVQLATYCFLIPAFYIAPKMWLWIPNYLLESPEKTEVADALVRSWRDTNNFYWPTLGLMALTVVGLTVCATIATVIAAAMVAVFHPLAILATPLLVAVISYALAQLDWAWLQWAVLVRRRADALASATAAPIITSG